MMPYIQKGDLKALHGKRRNAICGCKVKCDDFYIFIHEKRETDFILCAEEAKAFAFEIFELMGLVKVGTFQNLNIWTAEDEHFIKKFLIDNKCYDENGKLRLGTTRKLAEIMGKTRLQVKGKIQSMRRAGKL